MSFLDNVVADIEAVWVKAEGFVEAEAIQAWQAFRGIFEGLLPAQWTILQGLIQRAEVDILNGDIADLETALLNEAAKQELAWVRELGSEVIQAFLAIVRANAAVPAK